MIKKASQGRYVDAT